jgi:NADPH-dependent 2,4-dienoyl-CoA reductase/sulfur reductase-like enzyme/rhodanese-related sulfurtransferase
MSEQNSKQPSQDQEKDYLRVLSHQLKSPINAIQALLKTITEGYTGDVSPKTKQVIEKAFSRSEEAKELVSDLLDFQRYSQGKSEAQEEYDLVALCREIVNSHTTSASEHDVTLQSDLPSRHTMYIFGDPRGMKQALRNLVENGIKYTPAGGSVTVRLRLLKNQDQCQLNVIDTGYGIPDDEITQIFEPFFRSVKHKSNISGTGLGLPIVKYIVENHGGSITVHSQENQGTTFDILLPVSEVKRFDEDVEPRRQVLIIGGVTAGPKAAARLRRLEEELDITIIEKKRFLSYSGCGLPEYISGNVKSSKELMSSADATVRDIDFFESIQNIDIMNNTEALRIDREKKKVQVKDLVNQTETDLPYDYLVLATGADPSLPDIEGLHQEGIYTLNSLEDAEVVKKAFSRKVAQDVFIIGAGLVGISIAKSLVETGKRVTIIEKRGYILFHLMDRDIAVRLENELKSKGIKILTSENTQNITRTDRSLAIRTDKGTYNADLIIVSTGVTPNVKLAADAGLELGATGGVKVNSHLQTSDESIYAIGDCAESTNIVTAKHEYWPLGSISTKMGRIAANNIAGIDSEFHGSLGTALFQIMDINVARTGLNEREAWRSGFETETAVCTGLDSAHYYGNAEIVVLKVIADKQTQRLLGAQMYSRATIAGRIGILATAITQGSTLEECFKLDLGYAPAFNNPIDIVQSGCLVLKNKIDGLVNFITADEFEKQQENIDGVISVCPLAIYPDTIIPDSINIPLETIRDTRIPFEKDAKLVLYSRTSSGAYMAYRYLITCGFTNMYVLEGGYEFWSR